VRRGLISLSVRSLRFCFWWLRYQLQIDRCAGLRVQCRRLILVFESGSHATLQGVPDWLTSIQGFGKRDRSRLPLKVAAEHHSIRRQALLTSDTPHMDVSHSLRRALSLRPYGYMAKDICVRIGRRIRLMRTQRGWTQTMLADHAGLTREHLSELENGHKEIGARALERVVLALDSTLANFFEGFG
jgi:DNA-binding XRE family transcriptional regulator